jgi:cytochrome c
MYLLSSRLRYFTYAILLFGCSNCKQKAPPPPPQPPPVEISSDNKLSDAEKAEGFVSLFDGTTLTGWRNYNKQTIGKGWKIDQNAIYLDAKPNPSGDWQAVDGGDIVSADEYQDFELRLDWKIQKDGNSGIIYNVVETPKNEYVWYTGPEMQVLDNDGHSDGKIKKHRAGDLYDLISCSTETVKGPGEWNAAKLVSKGGHIEHWLNGTKVVEYTAFADGKPTKEWLALIKGSKFKDMPLFGRSNKGRIALQDHGNQVWYKNIRIKK